MFEIGFESQKIEIDQCSLNSIVFELSVVETDHAYWRVAKKASVGNQY